MNEDDFICEVCEKETDEPMLITVEEEPLIVCSACAALLHVGDWCSR